MLDTNIANKFEHVDVEEIEDETRRKSRMRKSVSRQKRIDDFFSCITKNNTEKCDVAQNIMQTFPSNAVVSKYQEVISDGFIQYLLVLRKEKRNKEFSEAFTVAFSKNLNNYSFIRYVAQKLEMYPYYLLERLKTWSNL